MLLDINNEIRTDLHSLSSQAKILSNSERSFALLWQTLFYLRSIAKLSFRGKQRNDPTKPERLGNVSTGTKVSSNNLWQTISKTSGQRIVLQVETSRNYAYKTIRMSILHLQVFQANQTHFHKIIFAQGRILKERQSRHSELSGKGTKLPLNWSNSENTYLLNPGKAEEIIIIKP